jgi:hypothetical protein
VVGPHIVNVHHANQPLPTRLSGRALARLETLRRLLEHIHARILPGVGFALWDGSTVPAEVAPDIPIIVIADEGAVAALIRRPTMHTVLNLWVTERIDLRNGTIFDLVARRPALRTRELVRRLDKRLVLSTVAKFLLVPRGVHGLSTPFAATRPGRTGRKPPTREISCTTMTSPTRSIRSFSIRR